MVTMGSFCKANTASKAWLFAAALGSAATASSAALPRSDLVKAAEKHPCQELFRHQPGNEGMVIA